MSTFLTIAAALVLLVTWHLLRARKRQQALREACREVFSSAYANVEHKPLLEMGYGYGVPTFKITHASLDAHQQSELSGANAAFQRGIQSVCGEFGSKSTPYQASRAIHFAWLAVGNEAFFPPAASPGRGGDA